MVNYGFVKVVALKEFGDSVPVMKPKLLSSGQHGFSLVELLVVIAVIAIIAAIAIPNIANITQQATVAKDRRNAQNIASVASAAKAAGATTDLSSSSAAFLALSGTVVSVVSGGQTLTFGVSTLSPAEQTGAGSFLTTNLTPGGAVLYTAAP